VGNLLLERGRGCAACRDTGYLGRTGIFELLVVTDTIRELLARSEEKAGLRQAALQQGMVPLREDGWRKVQAGVTTVEEVLRVVTE
jgi:type II secretory ATPase GspE/PulE/Tfp pilus assembly ATPase PilB-like protein